MLSCAEAPASDLPGVCVDPIRDSKTRLDAADTPTIFERFLGKKGEDMELSNGPDLDGDGVRDWLVTTNGYCGSGGCTYLLYVRRGSCGHFVGEASGRDVDLAGGTSHGLADITSSFHGGCCEWEETRSHFDGTTYRPAMSRTCEGDFMTLEDRIAIDPSYAMWSSEHGVICAPWHH